MKTITPKKDKIDQIKKKRLKITIKRKNRNRQKNQKIHNLTKIKEKKRLERNIRQKNK